MIENKLSKLELKLVNTNETKNNNSPKYQKSVTSEFHIISPDKINQENRIEAC